jgi:hypothetical protein
MTIVTTTLHVVYDCDHDNMWHNNRDRDDNFTPRDNSNRDTARSMATVTMQSNDSTRDTMHSAATATATHGAMTVTMTPPVARPRR